MHEPREDEFFDAPISYRLVKPCAAQPSGAPRWNTRAMLAWGIGALLFAAVIGTTLALLGR